MDRERARLKRLEEQATNRRSHAQAPHGRPSDLEEDHALERGYEEWRSLMRAYGWSDAEIDEEDQWTATVNRRCDEAGYEPWMVLRDMCLFVEAQGLPIGEQQAAFDRYPGPDYWGPPGGSVG